MTGNPANGSPLTSISIAVIGDELRHLFEAPGRLGRRLVAAGVDVTVDESHFADLDALVATGDSARGATADVVLLDGGLFVVAALGDAMTTSTSPTTIRADIERRLSEVARQVIPTGARLFVIGVSTFDPADDTTVYTPGSTTAAQVAHAVDAAILATSASDAISFIDTDRIVAELGAMAHVRALLDYTAPVWDVVADELALVLIDYGFFDDRPVLVQTPRGAAG